MLEVFIIICLGIALFLLLRHYPEARKTPESGIKQIKAAGVSKSFWRVFSSGFKIPNLRRLPKKKTLPALSEETTAQPQTRQETPAVKPEILTEEQKKLSEIEELLFRSDQALGSSELREAEDFAIEAVGKDKRCAKAYVNIGTVAYLRGQFAEAKEAFLAGLKCEDETGGSYFGLGLLLLREDNFTGAIEYFQRAVLMNNTKSEWYAELGKAYMEVRQYAKAAKALRKASNIDMDNKEYKILASEAEDKQRTHSYYGKLR